MLSALLLTTLCLASPDADAGVSADTPADAGVAEIHLHGNLVMPEEVYRAIISLPSDAVADVPTANLLREQILSFLMRAGYELAQVHVAVVGPALEVDIDEGQLEKIVFRGKLTLQQLQFRLALVLPDDVFNRPEVEREIKKLREQLHLDRVWYELVPTQAVQHMGPQVEELPEIQGFELVHAQRRFELHVFFTEHDWDTGAGIDLQSGFPDGIEMGATYQGKHLLFDDDRWRVEGSGGLNLRQAILDNHFYGNLSRLFGDARWYAPDVGHGLGRPFIWLRAEGTARQRPDLCIENYYNEQFEGSLNFQYQFAPHMTISLGGGTQFRRLFGVYAGRVNGHDLNLNYCLPDADPATDPLAVEPDPGLDTKFPTHLRSFGLLKTDLVFDDGAVRWDRRHAITATAKYFFGIIEPHYGEVRARYQKVWAFGWHDIWLRARGAFLWGEVSFHDEEPIGQHLRGVFGTEFVHHAASVSSEFRFSITRDIFKVSVFHDLAMFGHITNRDPTAYSEILEVADSFGAGFHALVEGMIQVDIYLAFGFRSHRDPAPGPPSVNSAFSTGGSINLDKVF